jgi:hypothetical protein
MCDCSPGDPINSQQPPGPPLPPGSSAAGSADSHHGLSHGAVAGIAVGGAVFAAGILAAVCASGYRKRPCTCPPHSGSSCIASFLQREVLSCCWLHRDIDQLLTSCLYIRSETGRVSCVAHQLRTGRVVSGQLKVLTPAAVVIRSNASDDASQAPPRGPKR